MRYYQEMQYRVAWRSTITGRMGTDPWMDDREVAQASLEAQARRWPEMEHTLEVRADNGTVTREPAATPVLERMPRRPPLA